MCDVLQAQLAVDCCLRLVGELCAVSTELPVLMAVDDYNALYGPTGYGRTVTHTSDRGLATYRRQLLQVEQLNLVRGEAMDREGGGDRGMGRRKGRGSGGGDQRINQSINQNANSAMPKCHS